MWGFVVFKTYSFCSRDDQTQPLLVASAASTLSATRYESILAANTKEYKNLVAENTAQYENLVAENAAQYENTLVNNTATFQSTLAIKTVRSDVRSHTQTNNPSVAHVPPTAVARHLRLCSRACWLIKRRSMRRRCRT